MYARVSNAEVNSVCVDAFTLHGDEWLLATCLLARFRTFL